jgi:ABC-type multidrug transport system permease subunit
VPRLSLVLDRIVADSSTNAWSTLTTATLGFAFISSAYVPGASMPGWLPPFSEYQPITPMVNAVRALLTGSSSDVGLALAWSGALLLLICLPVAVIRYRRA